MGGLTPPPLHRGDVWWADLPGEGKARPVLVLTRDRFIPRLRSVVVAPVTSVIRGIPTEVELTIEDGMPRASAANFDNLLTVEVDRFRERITQLGGAKLIQVCQAYRFAADC